jgi:transcriptional regulator with XRE-family HTH domain
MRFAREAAGMSQTEFARRVGVSASLVCGIERGTQPKPVAVSTARRFAAELGLDDGWVRAVFGEIHTCQCSPDCAAPTFGRYAERHQPSPLTAWKQACQERLSAHLEATGDLTIDQVAEQAGCVPNTVRKHHRGQQLDDVAYQYPGAWWHDPPWLFKRAAVHRVQELLAFRHASAANRSARVG